MFRIRIRVDPDSNCQAGSGSVFGFRILKVKLSYKNPLFPKKFHDFHLALKMIPNKSSLFNKIPRYLLENKNKIPTFWVENQNFSKNFVLAFEFFFCLDLDLDPDPDWKKSRIRIRKKRIRIQNTELKARK